MLLEYIFDPLFLLIIACEDYQSVFQVLPVAARDLIGHFIPQALREDLFDDVDTVVDDRVCLGSLLRFRLLAQTRGLLQEDQ